jgi:hypothetical protein
MTTYVLGAGASLHAGYPLVKDMGEQLLTWMKQREDNPDWAVNFRWSAGALEEQFSEVSDFGALLDQIQNIIDRQELGYSVFANHRFALMEALRGRFAEIHQNDGATAYQLLAKMIQPGDFVIAFNYDVSLDRELKRANLWTLGDG